MSALKGDFISFSFNGVHSSELGIIRTSDGSRFNENLLPTIQDKTVQVPGGDGTYFFGSYYTQRQFNVPIAFDSLTEEQVRRLYSHFGDKQIHELIFDERPYKYYMAKINGTPQIKTICFEVEGQRIYKGEGTLNFICYYPFAKSRFKYLDDFSKLKIKIKENGKYKKYTYADFYNNLKEWDEASGMLNSRTDNSLGITLDYNNGKGSGTTSVNFYNPGDFEADFKLYMRFPTSKDYNGEDNEFYSHPSFTLNLASYDLNGKIVERNIFSLKLNTIVPIGTDNFFCINSATNLIEGGISGCAYDEKTNPQGSLDIMIDNKSFSGNLYNKYIDKGDFFKIPANKNLYYNLTISYDSTNDNISKGCRGLEYNYIYF